jgi:hypothetical protein
MLWRVLRQAARFAGTWKTLYAGNEPGARQCYQDVRRRPRRGNVVLLHGEMPVLWSLPPSSREESAPMSAQPICAESLVVQLHRQGYRHQPVALVTDIRLAAETPCDRCGAVGLAIYPFWRGAAHRNVLVCRRCDHQQEA